MVSVRAACTPQLATLEAPRSGLCTSLRNPAGPTRHIALGKLESLHAYRGEFSFSLGYIKRGGEKGRHGVREGGRGGTQERGPGGMT